LDHEEARMARRRRRQLATVAVIAAALALAGATGARLADREPAAAPAAVPSDQLAAPDGTAYNARDVWFVRMMIPHHAQALELAALAPDRAGNPRLRAFAERISIAQGPEIAVLRAWLDARGLAESDPDHPHEQMPGMQSPEAIRALAATTGEAFDARFVEMMADHHQGAVDMATELMRSGVDEQVQRLASAIAIEQSVEITRLRELD
jgi:uncharacterized protein (DUF305 family)